MKQIRKNVFETNSSSTHALCLDTHNNYPKYTQEHLDAFTDIIYPFSEEEASKFNDPHIFFELKDKIRYFWTIFVHWYFGNTNKEQEDFMCKLQTILPRVSFAYKFPHLKDGGWVYFRNNAAYMEDAEYVIDDEDDSVAKWDIPKLKDFLLNGVIVFGDRDNYDYYLMKSRIKILIDDKFLKVINEYTG